MPAVTNKPVMGDAVILHLNPKGQPVNGSYEHPATVTRVWSDECVNVVAQLDAVGSKAYTSVMRKGGPNDHGGDTWAFPEPF